MLGVFLFVFALFPIFTRQCSLGTDEVTVKSYSTVDDQKPVLVQAKPIAFRKDLKGYAKLIFLYGSVPELCSDMFELDSLEIMQMNYMNISTLEPGCFESMPNLRQLNLKVNQITEIKRGVFNGLQIKYLLLTSNKISHIDTDAFDDLPNLEMVFLEDNKIDRIDHHWFRDSPRLRILSLETNYLTEVQAGAFRHIQTSPDSKVKLFLNHNRIYKVDRSAFGNLEYIDVLELSHNKISWIQRETFRKAIVIKKLGLRYNGLTLGKSEIDTYRAVEEISLTGNPMVHCDFLDGLKQFNKTIMGTVNCFVPSDNV